MSRWMVLVLSYRTLLLVVRRGATLHYSVLLIVRIGRFLFCRYCSILGILMKSALMWVFSCTQSVQPLLVSWLVL